MCVRFRLYQNSGDWSHTSQRGWRRPSTEQRTRDLWFKECRFGFPLTITIPPVRHKRSSIICTNEQCAQQRPQSQHKRSQPITIIDHKVRLGPPTAHGGTWSAGNYTFFPTKRTIIMTSGWALSYVRKSDCQFRRRSVGHRISYVILKCRR